MPEHTLVAEPRQVVEVAELVGRAQWLAIDTESDMLFVHQARVCLIQMNVEGVLLVFDTVALMQADPLALEPIRPHLEDGRRLIFAHGGTSLARSFVPPPLLFIFSSHLTNMGGGRELQLPTTCPRSSETSTSPSVVRSLTLLFIAVVVREDEGDGDGRVMVMALMKTRLAHAMGYVVQGCLIRSERHSWRDCREPTTGRW
jgi:hypothetical protein